MKKLLLALVSIIAIAAAILYFSPATLLSVMRFIELERAGLTEQHKEVAQLSIHYYEGGPADGETILMVHGFGANKDNWLTFARYFTPRYHVIALDIPGFGESSKPDASYDVGSQTERVAAFTKALGIEKLHIIGNSMGGHISALYAARHPEQVLSVALFDNAGVTAPKASELRERLQRGEPNPLVVTRAEDFHQLLEFAFVVPPKIPARVQQYLGELAVANSDRNSKIFRQLVERYIPLEPELPKIQAPTLLLWGDQDRVLDVSSIAVMKPLLKRPSVVIMKDCGHAPMLERPAESAEHYQRFLDSLPKPAS
ncbi:alpha/beta fold hydrolase [Pseudomonas sp. UL073]|uniref:Alpha/beta fold hydrolase n=1 Tax=Zestomonas insulae TaxID=2809017 RepID=A0ABS2IGW3_9GAMM|nr:alpha/beta fold hydrolase [Pseudomonas insulae]MBM7062192.1 alpha/beta fold hydrolase [Pseudomonas insulae]